MSTCVTEHSADRLLADYQVWMRSWGAAENTVEARIAFATARCLEWGDLTAATPQLIQKWLGQPHFSDSTRATYGNHLRSLFGWMLDSGRLESDPMGKVRRSRQPRNVPKPLTPPEAELVLARAKGQQRAWIMLALYAGLRAHEIAKLRGEDVSERTLYVRGKGGKEAFVPTHPLIWELAQKYPDRGYWFRKRQGPGHVSADTVTNMTARLFRLLGIDGSIHRCRHSYATTLLRAGANIRIVQTLMRHDSLATTAAYCAVDEDERRAAIGLLG